MDPVALESDSLDQNREAPERLMRGLVGAIECLGRPALWGKLAALIGEMVPRSVRTIFMFDRHRAATSLYSALEPRGPD